MQEPIPSPVPLPSEVPPSSAPRVPRVVKIAGGTIAVVIAIVAVAAFVRMREKSEMPSQIPSPVERAPSALLELPQPPADSDGDRLLNDEETALGTNPFHPDTDNDELFDAAEVRIYKTDPKNPDTDGDGHKDGAEVRAGYNPAGTGKL